MNFFKRTVLLLLSSIMLFSFSSAEEDEEITLSQLMGETEIASDEDSHEMEELGTFEEDSENVYDDDGVIRIKITAAGDFTIGGDSRKRTDIFADELNKQNGDINFIMRNIKDVLSDDDLTIVNFEGTLTNSDYVPAEKKENEFLFSAPPEWANVLKGNSIEAVSLENNHVLDHGEEVYEETQQHLNDAGVVWSNSDNIGVYDVKGIQIAMLSYLCIDRYDKLWDKVPEDIAAAKGKYPIVIVSFHWGTEAKYIPTDNQIKMGRLAVDSGADLVLGHHSHRIQPIEYYNGKYICYSLGNFCFSGNKKPSDMTSFLFRITFVADGDSISTEGFNIVPIRIYSHTERNDFTPTIITKPSSIDGIVSTLKENGKKLAYAVENYPVN